MLYICITTIITIIILCYTLFKIRKYDDTENYILSITYINDIIDNYFTQHSINIKINNDIKILFNDYANDIVNSYISYHMKNIIYKYFTKSSLVIYIIIGLINRNNKK